MKQPSASLNGCVVCPQTLCLQLAEIARDKLTAENLKNARTQVGCPPLGKHKLLVGKKKHFCEQANTERLVVTIIISEPLINQTCKLMVCSGRFAVPFALHEHHAVHELSRNYKS